MDSVKGLKIINFNKPKKFRIKGDAFVYSKPGFYPNNRISFVKHNDIVESTEMYVDNESKKVSFYKIDKGYIIGDIAEEVFDCKCFASTNKKTEIKKNKRDACTVAIIPENSLVTIDYKTKHYTFVVYKDKQGYILNENLIELDRLTESEQYQLLRDTILYKNV